LTASTLCDGVPILTSNNSKPARSFGELIRTVVIALGFGFAIAIVCSEDDAESDKSKTGDASAVLMAVRRDTNNLLFSCDNADTLTIKAITEHIFSMI